jgi:cytochrome o ubiquinol oxidase subunit 1
VPEWRPWILLSALGTAILICSAVCQLIQLAVSIRNRDKLRDVTGDPWDGRTLEWATPSPPPAFNFAHLPHVENLEAYWNVKQRAREELRPDHVAAYEDIEMPRNSPTGFVCAFFATVIGFALIWHIWWMMILGLIGAYATFVVFAWRDVPEYVIPAEEVARIDRANRSVRDTFLSELAT